MDELYKIEVPSEDGSHTTYNVGAISGGTSVNTIAESAEMLYEYRSDDRHCLEKMKEIFMDTVSRCTPSDVGIYVEMIGERPCTGDVDEQALSDLIERGEKAVRTVTRKEPVLTAGSTDCNIPLAAGIPAICLGVCVGGKCHTREEWLDTASLKDGCHLFMEFFKYYQMKL